MTTFIFVHGSWHAAWNWHRVLPLVQQAGHTGIAIDVPGHGRDRTPASQVTLERCTDAVLRSVDAQPDPVVLVAHSRNGIVISQAAERRPARIAGLVYLAAYLVPDGKSMMEYAIQDRTSLVLQHVETPLSPRLMRRLIPLLKNPAWRWLIRMLLPRRLQSHRLKRSVYHAALYNHATDEVTALANALLEPEPNWPGFTPLQLTAERYGRVPKIYIECLQDRAVTIELQRKMYRESPCDEVYTLDSDHSPFFSHPQQLVDTLVDGLAVFAQRAPAPIHTGLPPMRGAA
jgi:pimeloyl-ACP methyl ester carboxylesterase